MTRIALTLAFALSSITPASAQDPDDALVAIGAASSTSFVSVDHHGQVRRHDVGGRVTETLGTATPFDGQNATARIEAAADGAIVASTDVLRVRGGHSETIVSAATLQAAGCGRIVDFAFATDGRGALLAYDRGSDGLVILAVEAGALRRVATLPVATSPALIALDPSARWIAVMRPALLAGSGGGPLQVYAFADGRLLWEAERCEGPSGGATLTFAGRILVGCARATRAHQGSPALAGYDASSGRQLWRVEIADVHARSADGATLLVEGLRTPVSWLDARTGRTRALGVSWGPAPDGGVVLDTSHIALRQPDRAEPIVVDVPTAPWARPF